jgi:hypothetical protein
MKSPAGKRLEAFIFLGAVNQSPQFASIFAGYNGALHGWWRHSCFVLLQMPNRRSGSPIRSALMIDSIGKNGAARQD